MRRGPPELSAEDIDRSARETHPDGRPRDRVDVVLGFVAGAAVVGLPLASVVLGLLAGGARLGIRVPGALGLALAVCVVVVVAAGVLGGRYGDRFFDWVADSTWWAALRRPRGR